MISHTNLKAVQQKIYVWDAFVRFFHWMLVANVTVAFLTENALIIHVLAGYAVGALIAARVVWGFIGSRYARFSAFVYAPSTTIQYIRDLFILRAGKRRIGHSPGGVYVIMLLLIFLAGTVVTGILVYADEQLTRSLAGLITKQTAETVEEWHGIFAHVFLALICVHIVGICLRSFVYRENLVRAMFTGYKRK